MSSIEIDFLLNLASEVIGIALTVTIVAYLIRRQEKKKTRVFQEKIHSRIVDHIGIMSTWIQALTFQKDKEFTELTRTDLINRKKELSQLSQIGESVLEPDLRKELIELDRRIDILINMHSVVVEAPANVEEWNRTVEETMSQIIVVSKLISTNMRADTLALSCEAWMEVFKSKYRQKREIKYSKKDVSIFPIPRKLIRSPSCIQCGRNQSFNSSLL